MRGGEPSSEKLFCFLANFIIESDAIEGIKNCSELLGSQLESGWRDGHVGAMLFLESCAKEKRIITENLIRKVQRLITAEQHLKRGGGKLGPEFIGQYRQVGMRVNGKSCPAPAFIHALMNSWTAWVARWQKDSPAASLQNLHQIASFHYHYLIIHPFADGNGRSARALSYYLLRYCGLPPFVFTGRDKHVAYYPCFDKDDPGLMCKYFEERAGFSR